MLINESINLEQLRTAAKLSQADMSARLGVSQSQISRYEQDPDEVPHKIIRKWVEYCGFVSSSNGIELGEPFKEIQERIKLMISYKQAEPEKPIGVQRENISIKADSFIQSVQAIARKPRVGLLGYFDTGKSRLGNFILGGDRLPTSYQPATSIICLIRHINEKPVWQAEDVWVMKKGFDLDCFYNLDCDAEIKRHCEDHKLFAGGFDALKQYGTHTGSGNGHKAFASIVYADAPLLLGCDLLDMPGYGHSDDDQYKAEMGHKMVDVLLYLSLAQGFLDQNDLNYLSVLMRHLPSYETPGNENIKPLRNLMIVATRSDLVGGPITGILDASSARAYKHLHHAIEERTNSTKVEISYEDFRGRFFSFSADNPNLRTDFEDDIKELLINVLPNITLYRTNTHVKNAKAAAAQQCDSWMSSLQRALNERELAQTAIHVLQEEEPERLRKKAEHEQRIINLVDELKKESVEIVSTTFSNSISVDSIERLIKSRYDDDKKEARQLAGSYLLSSIQNNISKSVQKKAELFAEKVDTFLGEYKTSIEDGSILSDGWDFNARTAFMGALAGLTTFGALATWASVAAAGSNLGAYLLIPSIVSFMSGLGISVGGTSAAISVASVMGGPITIGIAIAIGAALLFGFIFGDSWQKKLAKKIRENIIEKNTEGKVRDSINKYWTDTKTAFIYAVKETENVYQANVARLHTLAFSTSRDEIEAELKFAQEIRDFFAGMPWRSIKS